MRRAGAVAAIALLFAACGGGDDAGKPSAKGSTYEIALPSGWTDRTARVSSEDDPIRYDSVLVTGFEDGFRTNVNVLRQAKPAGTDLDGVVKASERQTHDVPGTSGFTDPRSAKVGSEDARAYTYVLNTQKLRLRGEQVIAEHDGRFYYITFTAQRNAYGRRHAEFQRMLDSWRWN